MIYFNNIILENMDFLFVDTLTLCLTSNLSFGLFGVNNSEQFGNKVNIWGLLYVNLGGYLFIES